MSIKSINSFTESTAYAGTDSMLIQTAAGLTKKQQLSVLGQAELNSLNYGIYNFQLSNGTDTVNDIDIAAGKCLDNTYMFAMASTATMTKQLNSSWVAGSSAGGLLESTMALSKTYHVFAIASTGVVDFGFSTSLTLSTAVLPAGYTYSRRIGSVMIDTSTSIIQFIHYWQNKTYLWQTVVVDISDASIGSTDTVYAMTVPNGINVSVLGVFSCGLSADNVKLTFSVQSGDIATLQTPVGSPDGSTFRGVASNYYYPLGGYDFGGGTIFLNLITNTSKQIKAIRIGSYQVANYYSNFQTHGFIDFTA